LSSKQANEQLEKSVTASLSLAWQPGRIGSIEIKNRLVRTANTTMIGPDALNDDFVGYHLARARGGVGLTILEAGSVHPSSQLAYMVDDVAVPFFRKMMTAIRPHGMRVFQQLMHGGHVFPGSGGTVPWAVSATPIAPWGNIGVPMSKREIKEVIGAFADAAVRCKEGNLDGVELHAGHGYLFQQFLSPLTNLRTDEYNGSLLDRARFLIETLEAVRKAVGPDFPVGVRLSCSPAKGGCGPDDQRSIATHLDKLGLIDFLDISFGDYFYMHGICATMASPAGYELPTSTIIGTDVKVPRIVTGRFRAVDEAEQVLREGAADFVSMVRANIADPELVRKSKEGRHEDVRPCIACNQGCQGGLLQIRKMRCTVNPAAGYESTLDESLIVRTAEPKKVMVVGGGPAGLEAARVAALRGHKVVLAEASADLGGMLQTARRAPHMHILGDLIAWYQRQVFALGVEIRLGTYVEAAEVEAESPDVLLVATGGSYREDGRQMVTPGELPTGMNLPHVYNPATLLQASLPSLEGKAALVFDDVGRYEAIAAAEHLAQLGAAVTFVTSCPGFAARMQGTNRDVEALARLNRQGMRLLTTHQLLGIESDFVSVRAHGLATLDRVPADVVVVMTNPEPARSLFDDLRDTVADVRLIGDALAPRDLLAAIHDGHRTARIL
jgi:2,4-dienoyl-CoA reductase-like NADH-dependent reductase (Old Yellow Enzyme family)/thioredoxin reductase